MLRYVYDIVINITKKDGKSTFPTSFKLTFFICLDRFSRYMVEFDIGTENEKPISELLLL